LQQRHRGGEHFHSAGGIEARPEIANVKRWIDHAPSWARRTSAFLRARRRRQFQGPGKDPLHRAIEECCEYAGGKGIFLGLEITAHRRGADPVLEIVRAVKSRGSRQSGHRQFSHRRHLRRPCEVRALCGQRSGQDRDFQARAKKEPAIARVIKILRDANYQGYVAWSTRPRRPVEAVPDVLAIEKLLAG